MRYRILLSAFILAGCGTTEPSGGISFKPDAASCSGSAVLDLFIDGTKVASPTLSAGAGSPFYPVANGSHVASAISQSSGAEWPSETVTVTGPTTFVLPCSANRPLEAFHASIVNRLVSEVIITNSGVSDTIPAEATTQWRFVGNGGFSWRPVPLRYSDGSLVPDDDLIGAGTLTHGGTVTLTARDVLGQQYFTFSIANSSGVSISVGVHSGISLQCLANLPAATGEYLFGYYQLRSSAEVHVYRGANCTGSGIFWDFADLSTRDPESGYIALPVTTPP